MLKAKLLYTKGPQRKPQTNGEVHRGHSLGEHSNKVSVPDSNPTGARSRLTATRFVARKSGDIREIEAETEGGKGD